MVEKATSTTAKKTTVKKKPAAVVDVIIKSATAIENLTKPKAFAMVKDLLDATDFNLFQVGGALAIIQDNGWYNDEGYESLKDFVEGEYGMQYRKAMYWIAIYKSLVESGVPWASVKDLGWSKLRLVASELTVENVDEYVATIKDMTQNQLVDHLKNLKNGSVETSGEGDEDKTPDKPKADDNQVSSMTFKVHSDQKEIITEAVDSAKNDANTEYDNVALEAICMSYLNGGGAAAPAKPVKGFATLRAAMKSKGYEEVFKVFETLWPDIEIDVTINEEADPEDEDAEVEGEEVGEEEL